MGCSYGGCANGYTQLNLKIIPPPRKSPIILLEASKGAHYLPFSASHTAAAEAVTQAEARWIIQLQLQGSK